ncbi:YHYH domain-containing protein [Aliikangiella sp. IMCC44653]
MQKIKNSFWCLSFALLACGFLSAPIEAHPGATDKEGCHVSKKDNKKHCHKKRDKKENKISKKSKATEKDKLSVKGQPKKLSKEKSKANK